MGTPSPPIPLLPVYALHILHSLPAHRTLHALFCVYVLHPLVSFGGKNIALLDVEWGRGHKCENHQSLLQMILFTSKSFNLELLSCTETRF